MAPFWLVQSMARKSSVRPCGNVRVGKVVVGVWRGAFPTSNQVPSRSGPYWGTFIDTEPVAHLTWRRC